MAEQTKPQSNGSTPRCLGNIFSRYGLELRLCLLGSGSGEETPAFLPHRACLDALEGSVRAMEMTAPPAHLPSVPTRAGGLHATTSPHLEPTTGCRGSSGQGLTVFLDLDGAGLDFEACVGVTEDIPSPGILWVYLGLER